tara:strand:- start:25822 stop:27363 length:1542 start_codon:yes stop_codon:yes gene_type:complete
MSNKNFSRREFMKTGLFFGASTFIPESFPLTNILSNKKNDNRRIIVIGAGLSGLTCAYDLFRAGYNVLIIEARTRPGGRVRTYRDSFADNLYAEMGAEYVDSSDQFVRKYAEEFGLKIRKAKLYDGVFVRGKKFSMKELQLMQKQLPYIDVEGGNLFGQEKKYINHYVERIINWSKENILSPIGPYGSKNQKNSNSLININNLPKDILDLDNLSVADLLRKEGAHKDIIELYTFTNATESTGRPEDLSALSMVLNHAMASGFNEETDEGRIQGGNDQLPKAFAKFLSNILLYNRPVKKIKHDKYGVDISFLENGKLTSIKGNKCVISMPLSILRRTNISPTFADDKMHCIREQSYGHVMKIAMQFKHRFWDENKSFGQRVFTDTPLRRVYHHSIDQPGPRGILLSFTSGSDAQRLGRMNEKRRMETAQITCRKIWPNTNKYWEGGISKYWNEDPWMRGSYSMVGVGQKNFREILARKEGFFHFAGEHTSIYRSSMNGAIESGLRASKEIQIEL